MLALARYNVECTCYWRLEYTVGYRLSILLMEYHDETNSQLPFEFKDRNAYIYFWHVRGSTGDVDTSAAALQSQGYKQGAI
jgi:hypothetical protein